jgi:hypothetical protein
MAINEARAEHISCDQEDVTDERSDLRRNEALRWSQMPDAADLRVLRGRKTRKEATVSTSEGATPRQGGWVNKEHNLFIVERDYGLEEATRSFGRMYFILTGVETFLLYHCKDDASRARVC